MPDSKVVIVGAGPVGLITALGLARAGVGVTVIEALPRPSAAPHDMVYRWSALPGLADLGILGDMESAGGTVQRWCYKVLGTGEQFFFDLSVLAGEVAHPYNVHLPQDRLAEVVTAHLARFPHAKIEWATRVTQLAQDARGVTVIAEGSSGARTYRADWVIGADSAHSTVRRALGIGFAGTTWPERLVATDIRYDLAELEYSQTAYQLDPEHGALIAQVGGSGLWRYVYAESRLLPEETVPERMPAAFAAVLPGGADPRLQAWSAYRVHERAAGRFRVGRVVLAGDAAHVTNPANSLGLAGGLFDAFVLTEALTAVVDGDAGDDVLDRYAEARRRVFLDLASPLSSETMSLVFHSENAERLDSELDYYRQIAAHPDRQREFFHLDSDLQTPSLLRVRAT